MTWYLALLALLGLERVGELVISRRNAARALARGAIEVGQRHFQVMKALHTAFFVACAAEVVLLHRPFIPSLGVPMLVLVVLAQVLRYWAVLTLGRRWNVRAPASARRKSPAANTRRGTTIDCCMSMRSRRGRCATRRVARDDAPRPEDDILTPVIDAAQCFTHDLRRRDARQLEIAEPKADVVCLVGARDCGLGAPPSVRQHDNRPAGERAERRLLAGGRRAL